MSRRKTTLPAKPSALIRVAMDDLNRVERLKTYYVDMETWHQNDENPENAGHDTCHVCFAGAVMAQTLGAKPDEYVDPGMFNDKTHHKLLALDIFRCGEVGMAFEEMDLDPKRGEEFDREIPHYRHNRRGFKLAMRKLIRDLAKAKL